MYKQSKIDNWITKHHNHLLVLGGTMTAMSMAFLYGMNKGKVIVIAETDNEGGYKHSVHTR